MEISRSKSGGMPGFESLSLWFVLFSLSFFGCRAGVVLWLAWCSGSGVFWSLLACQPTNSFCAPAGRGRGQTIFCFVPRLFCSGRSSGSRPRPLAPLSRLSGRRSRRHRHVLPGQGAVVLLLDYLDRRRGFHAGGFSVLALARVVRFGR